MKKWSKLLAVPMTLALLAGCAGEGTVEETEDTSSTEQTTEQTSGESSTQSESSGESSEETDANSEATEDTEETDANSEASPDGGATISEGSSITPEEALETEDIDATGEAAKGTTIQDVDMNSDEWVEQAAEATNAVEGDTYVQLDRGVLTVDQIDNFLKAQTVELTYADDNNQFLYYNYHTEAEDMLGARRPGQAGSPLSEVHPESAYENLAWVINVLRTGEQDHVRMAVPSGSEDQYVVHDYYGIYDDDGNYMGVNEVIHDIMPQIDFYLEETGQDLAAADNSEEEATPSSSETESSEETDANSEATEDTEETDANSEASPDGGATISEGSSITPEEASEAEDIEATGEAEKGSTIQDVDMNSDEWVEQAAEATDAVEGDTYVQLDRGVLTVDQIDNFLKAMPVELTYADDNNQFLYYNYHTEAEDMLGARRPGQAGSPLNEVHPESAYENLSWVVNVLRTGEQDHVRMAVPSGSEDQFVVHDYHGIYDDEGNYMGVNEVIHDIMPQVEFYLEETGQELVSADGSESEEETESSSSDSESSGETDADSSASE